jgi:two-component system KDP operon response regulator KdpE
MAKLLVVDDDIDVVIVVVAEAKARGFVAIGTMDPTEVPRRLREYRPDVVLLDLRMGSHDGRDVLARIKADTETAGTVVIVISGADDPHTVALCRGYGAADFVRKPFVMEELFRRIERVLASPARSGPQPVDGDSG